MAPFAVVEKSDDLEQTMYSRQALDQLTFRYDCLRSVTQGIAHAGLVTIGLLVAIRVFEAPPSLKAAIPAASALGWLFSPVILAVLSNTPWRSTGICAGFLVVSAMALLLAGIVNGLVIFTLLLCFVLTVQAQQAPFMIQAYSVNYIPSTRGSRLSVIIMLSAFFGSVFLYFSGWLLDSNMDHWRVLFVVMAASSAVAGWAVYQIPSRPMDHFPRSRPLENLALLRRDRVFGIIVCSWTFLGVGVLMMYPLRVEYLASPEYGINATNEQIAMLTFILPAIVQIISTRFWGRLFDRTNIIFLRNCINVGYMVSIVLFFTTKNLSVITIGSVMMGLANSGESLLWNLWVTKMAPPNRVQAYMSVHTSATGLRGFISPFIGFCLLSILSPMALCALSSGLIGVAILLLTMAKGDPRVR